MVKEKIMATLKAVTAYDMALLKIVWKMPKKERNVALRMADFGRLVSFNTRPVTRDGRTFWCVKEGNNFSADDVTRELASDDYVLESICFDMIDRNLEMLKSAVGFKREHRCKGGAYKFSFKIDNGVVVDVLQSPVDAEMITFEVNGETVLGIGDIMLALSSEIVG